MERPGRSISFYPLRKKPLSRYQPVRRWQSLGRPLFHARPGGKEDPHRPCRPRHDAPQRSLHALTQLLFLPLVFPARSWVERRGPRAENKAVTDTTFIKVSPAEGPK